MKMAYPEKTVITSVTRIGFKKRLPPRIAAILDLKPSDVPAAVKPVPAAAATPAAATPADSAEKESTRLYAFQRESEKLATQGRRLASYQRMPEEAPGGVAGFNVGVEAYMRNVEAYKREYPRLSRAAEALEGREVTVRKPGLFVPQVTVPISGIDVKKSILPEEAGTPEQIRIAVERQWGLMATGTLLAGTLIAPPLSVPFLATGPKAALSTGFFIGATGVVAPYGAEALRVSFPGKEEWRYRVGGELLGIATAIGAVGVGGVIAKATIPKATVISKTFLQPDKKWVKFEILGEVKGPLVKKPFYIKGITTKKGVVTGGKVVLGEPGLRSILKDAGKVSALKVRPGKEFFQLEKTFIGQRILPPYLEITKKAGLKAPAFPLSKLYPTRQTGVTFTYAISPKKLPIKIEKFLMKADVVGWERWTTKELGMTIAKTEKGITMIDISKVIKPVAITDAKPFVFGAKQIGYDARGLLGLPKTPGAYVIPPQAIITPSYVQKGMVSFFKAPPMELPSKAISYKLPGGYMALAQQLKTYKPPVEKLFEAEMGELGIQRPRVDKETSVFEAAGIKSAKGAFEGFGKEAVFEEFKQAGPTGTQRMFEKVSITTGPRLGEFLGTGITPGLKQELGKMPKFESMLRETERTKAIEKEFMATMPKVKTAMAPATKIATATRARTITRQIQRLLQPTIQAFATKAAMKQAQETMQQTIQRTSMKHTFKTTGITVPILLPTTKGFPSLKIPKKRLPGFEVFVRKAGRTTKVSRFPLAFKTALGLGAIKTETAARTFFLRPTRRPGRRLPGLEMMWRPERFRRPKGKSLLPPGAYVEKAKFAIDFPKEFEEITLKARRSVKRRKKHRKPKRRYKK